MSWTRDDYKRMIGLKGRRKGKKRKKMSGRGLGTKDALAGALLLGRMMSKKNRNAKQRSAIIDTMDNSQMKQFGRVMKSFISSKYKMPRQYLKKLKRDRHFVTAMMDPRVPLATKKKILSQKGGFIPAILPAILKTVAAPLLGNIVSKIF